ncbi:MAG: Holliday junction branch migration protein RuvA [Rickettsiaceae bacterium]|nr:Holliday junction branch migration protein RuvA [Rickettsiaceae bacterium]
MIGKLKGIVDSIYEDYVIIDVSGVGYMVFCSSKTLQNLEEGTACQLLIDTHVREDHIHLFGFKTAEEKSSFLILQSVSGIGTRMAITILSYMTPQDLQSAIDQKNKEAFRKVSGIGPKLAERMVVELKGKIFSNYSSGNAYSNNTSETNEISNDAISALINLGINRSEVITLVGNIMKEHPDITIDNLIRLALQKRSKL